MKKTLLALLALTAAAVAEAQHPEAVMNALAQADTNRVGLETLLADYKEHDDEKYQAACFLVANMPWNRQGYRVVTSDSRLAGMLATADAAYYSLVKDRRDAELYNGTFNKQVLAKADQAYRKKMEAERFEPPGVVADEFPDIRCIGADLLRRQIEHAFTLRRTVAQVRRLSLADFFEYVLPYRALNRSSAVSADVYAERYGKYLHADTTTTERHMVWRYNVTADRLRYWGGRYPFKVPIGLDEMFFLGYHDCVPIADFGAMILRACGQPTAIEYNVAYKFWNGRHYHVAVPTARGWETFSPESGLPRHRDPKFYEALNIFRQHFSRQADNPFSLRAKGEPIPDNLADPRIADVTHEIGDTVILTLPFTVQTSHKLAYLGTFVSQEAGLCPVTWGEIDQTSKTVRFRHVVPDNLYFPVYLDEEGDSHAFGSPFVLSKTGRGATVRPIERVDAKRVMAKIERKFPRKPQLREQAGRVPGTYVIASDHSDFSQADTLGVIRSVPGTSWEDIALDCKRPYRYYRVCGTGVPARLLLGEIRFLTKREYAYTNVAEAPANRVPVDEADKQWVWLFDGTLEQCRRKAEYDGNPQTAPDRWPDVTLKLEVPQYVHRLRYMSKHADNAVKPGAHYELLAWADGFWRRNRSGLAATGNVLEMDGLVPGQLYWLRQQGVGREELPFYIDESGVHHFPHLPFLEKLVAGRR